MSSGRVSMFTSALLCFVMAYGWWNGIFVRRSDSVIRQEGLRFGQLPNVTFMKWIGTIVSALAGVGFVVAAFFG